MPIENINFAGINRAITDYATTGACEELINLRPTTGGLVPVKPFNAIMSNASHEKVYIHHTSDGTDNYIVVDISSTSVTAYLYGSNPRVTFFDITGLASTAVVESVLNSVHFAYTGNIVLFSICDQDNGVYENHSYIWKDGSYSEMEANVPNITFSVSDTISYGYANFHSVDDSISSEAEISDIIHTKISEIQENNPELCTGPVLIAIAFKTKDGNTIWTGSWRIYDPVPKANASLSYVNAYSSFNVPFFNKTAFFNEYGHGYLLYDYQNTPETEVPRQYRYAGTKVDLVFNAINQGQTPDWVDDTSFLQSIEIYASRPQIYTDYSYDFSAYAQTGSIPRQYIFYPLPQLDYGEMDLADQLLYHQASIQLASLAEGNQTITLNFGGNVQLVNETLDADAGAVTRFGHLLAYNARFHYYDSVTNIKVGKPYFQINKAVIDTPQAYTRIYVRYTDEDESKLLYVDYPLMYIIPADIVIAPSLNIKSVITCAYYTDKWNLREYRMTESSTYNYSICTDDSYEEYEYEENSLPQEYVDAYNAGTGGFINKEPNAINVTEQYSPFVFRVEHSYLAPGRVLDIQPQMSYTADISYGEYPLNVFTQRGLYALLQGSANVLYGAFKPLSNLVPNSNGIPTEMGTFFLAAGSLWLVSGLHITLISDALSLGPHKFIRDCAGYKKISGGTNEASPQYDVSDYVSAVPFDDFSRNAVLAYSRFRDELFVSNPGYAYTYVLSLKYRQWFKISGILWQDEAGSTIANLKYGVNGLKDIVDLSTEKDTAWVTPPSPGAAPVYTPIPTVHLQTRPFSIAYQYTHIHRVVSMIRAALSSTCQVVVALYGSDNLQEWALLSYASRKGRVVNSQEEFLKFSQIRTASASRSWRYYTVCIGGKVPTDTDFGPVLFDYQPIERRFG